MNWETTAAYAVPIMTAITAGFLSMRKASAQYRKTQIDMWRELVVELKAELSNRSDELNEVKAQLVDLLRLSNEQLAKIAHLEGVVESQSRKIAELKRSIK